MRQTLPSTLQYVLLESRYYQGRPRGKSAGQCSHTGFYATITQSPERSTRTILFSITPDRTLSFGTTRHGSRIRQAMDALC